MKCAVCAVMLLLAVVGPLGADEPLRLYAAGSLRLALTEVAAAFTRASGIAVAGTFGASGLLRERIERGERADVFASADVGHPRRLADAGRAAAPTVFARNRLCALARPGLTVTTADLLDRMLDPSITLGTSTPGADPSGDYAWEVFRKADALRPGARRTLEAKALKLVGGREAPPPSADSRSLYTQLVVRGDADLFLTYCTNAAVVQRELTAAQIIALPADLAVGADYGITVLTNALPDAAKLVAFILSAEGQAILQRHGFSSPDAGHMHAQAAQGSAAPARPPLDLKSSPPGQQIAALTFCAGRYTVRLRNESVSTFPEYDLAFKTDTSPQGPPANAPVLIPAGRVGDRALAIFADPEELKRAIGRGC